MKSGIRSTLLLFFGVVAVMLACSTISFGQTPCITITLKQDAVDDYTPDEGSRVVSVRFIGGKVAVRVCSDSAANKSPAQHSTNTSACPNPPAQPTVTEAEARRQRQEEADDRRRNGARSVGGLGKWDQ
jgi:hypothetical protein